MYASEYYGDSYESCCQEEQELLKEVDSICSRHNLKWRYFPGGGYLFVYSNINTWKLDLLGEKIIIHHQNKSGCTNGTYSECFHKQKYKFETIRDTLLYISRHDNKKYRKDHYRHYNSPIEKAFRRI